MGRADLGMGRADLGMGKGKISSSPWFHGSLQMVRADLGMGRFPLPLDQRVSLPQCVFYAHKDPFISHCTAFAIFVV